MSTDIAINKTITYALFGRRWDEDFQVDEEEIAHAIGKGRIESPSEAYQVIKDMSYATDRYDFSAWRLEETSIITIKESRRIEL